MLKAYIFIIIVFLAAFLFMHIDNIREKKYKKETEALLEKRKIKKE